MKSRHLRECRQSRSTLRKVELLVVEMKNRDVLRRSERLRLARLPMPGSHHRHITGGAA